MKKDNAPKLPLQWRSLRLLERFKNVLYPIDMSTLLRLLPTIGYIVRAKTLKGVLEAGEPVAIKGNVELLVNQDNKTLGVEGRQTSEVINGFRELRSFWLEQLTPSPSAETHYVELAGQCVIRSLKNPTLVFTGFWSQLEGLGKLSRIVGFDVTNFGMRLVPQGMNPNNTDWFDLRIQQQVISSANHYFVDIVWRNKEMEKVMDGFSKVDETISALIREVERV